jgi:hypothetical protein
LFNLWFASGVFPRQFQASLQYILPNSTPQELRSFNHF